VWCGADARYEKKRKKKLMRERKVWLFYGEWVFRYTLMKMKRFEKKKRC